MSVCCDASSEKSLKIDLMGQWVTSDWLPRHPGQEWLTLWANEACLEADTLAKFSRDLTLPGGYRFVSHKRMACPVITPLESLDYEGAITYQSGAFVHEFVSMETDDRVEVLVMGAYFNDSAPWYQVTLACVPSTFVASWHAFAHECYRLSNALEPKNEVIIIGGRSNAFVPTVDWGDIVLPDKLKADILDDVQSFFTKGIDIYRRLNLKPFRKLLLAGVPGTGKTMICSALAKWALAHDYVVIYVSSAVREQGETRGSNFGKIQRALSVAAYSQHPALILLEELDAYLHPEEKAQVLNVLDGSEASINDKGTLLVATTNYPEAIDERILKRPGRLDRIFIVPETRVQADAEQMLRQYLGLVWHDDHRALVPHLVGYPGAFIREVAIYALTQLAYEDRDELPFEMLERSFQGLKEQLEARDDFLHQRAQQVAAANGQHAN